MRNVIAILFVLFAGCASNVPLPRAGVFALTVDIETPKGTVEKIVGTGFAIEPRIILTAEHVCMGAWREAGGPLKLNGIPLEIIASDPFRDLCVLGLSPEGEDLPEVIPLVRDDYRITLDSKVIVLGYPANSPMLIPTYGTFIGKHSVVGSNRLVLSCPAYPGNSGGPVINEKGEAIGVVIAIVGKYHHISFASAFWDIHSFLGL